MTTTDPCACGTEVFAHEPDANGKVTCAGALRYQLTQVAPNVVVVHPDDLPAFLADVNAQAAQADDGCQPAVDWLLRLRELQAQGLDFDTALAQANAESGAR